MNIQLKEWKVKKLLFNITEQDGDLQKKENSFNLGLGQFYPEESPNSFGIGFDIKVIDEDFDIHLEMVFLFEVDTIIDDCFKNSDFPKINAPAIAFPYVRSYISNLTLQSGFSSLILPSVNFVAFAKKHI